MSQVPTVEEQVRYVTRREVVEVEKRVPKYEYETVEQIVEVEVIVPVDKIVEIPKYVDTITEKKVVQFVDKPVAVTREIRIPRTIYRDEVKEVPGPVIERPKYYTVENKVKVPRPIDKEVPVIVAQTIKPVIIESTEAVVVEVMDYEPEIVPVDVHIAKPLPSALGFAGQIDSKHKLVSINAAQYNTILRQLNSHMDEQMKNTLPFVAENGTVAFVNDDKAHFIVAPANIEIEGWTRSKTTDNHSYKKEHLSSHKERGAQSFHGSNISEGGSMNLVAPVHPSGGGKSRVWC